MIIIPPSLFQTNQQEEQGQGQGRTRTKESEFDVNHGMDANKVSGRKMNQACESQTMLSDSSSSNSDKTKQIDDDESDDGSDDAVLVTAMKVVEKIKKQRRKPQTPPLSCYKDISPDMFRVAMEVRALKKSLKQKESLLRTFETATEPQMEEAKIATKRSKKSVQNSDNSKESPVEIDGRGKTSQNGILKSDCNSDNTDNVISRCQRKKNLNGYPSRRSRSTNRDPSIERLSNSRRSASPRKRASTRGRARNGRSVSLSRSGSSIQRSSLHRRSFSPRKRESSLQRTGQPRRPPSSKLQSSQNTSRRTFTTDSQNSKYSCLQESNPDRAVQTGMTNQNCKASASRRRPAPSRGRRLRSLSFTIVTPVQNNEDSPGSGHAQEVAKLWAQGNQERAGQTGKINQQSKTSGSRHRPTPFGGIRFRRHSFTDLNPLNHSEHSSGSSNTKDMAKTSPHLLDGRKSVLCLEKNTADKLLARLPSLVSPRANEEKVGKKVKETQTTLSVSDSETLKGFKDYTGSLNRSPQQVHPSPSPRRTPRPTTLSKADCSARKHREQHKHVTNTCLTPSKSEESTRSATMHKSAQKRNSSHDVKNRVSFDTLMDGSDASTVAAGNLTVKDRTTLSLYSEGKVEIGKDGKRRLVFEICDKSDQTDPPMDTVVVMSPPPHRQSQTIASSARRGSADYSPKKNLLSPPQTARHCKIPGRSTLPPPPLCRSLSKNTKKK